MSKELTKNVANTNSQHLTEQWREGKLPEDCYYILTKNGHVRKDRTCFRSHTDEQCFYSTLNRDIEEVLAPVPDYGIFCALNKMVKNINRREMQLTIAIKALENAHKFPQTMSLKEYCEQALKDIKEIK